MCPTRRNPKSRRSYHHGDLRRVLIDAALDVVQKQGLAALTMRSVARAAKVSHMAPYHHFEDKSALVAAVAAEGFRRMRSAMEERVARCSEGLRARLRESGIAYVVFAVENPNLFRVMFSAQMAEKSNYPELQDAASSAFALLRGLVDESQAGTPDDPDEGELISVSAWALVHGLAILCIDGQIGPEATDPEFAEKFAYQATGALYRGMARG
jgi:AcrR family transcriptional regulator